MAPRPGVWFLAVPFVVLGAPMTPRWLIPPLEVREPVAPSPPMTVPLGTLGPDFADAPVEVGLPPMTPPLLRPAPLGPRPWRPACAPPCLGVPPVTPEVGRPPGMPPLTPG